MSVCALGSGGLAKCTKGLSYVEESWEVLVGLEQVTVRTTLIMLERQ